jgi:O-antigen ligase
MFKKEHSIFLILVFLPNFMQIVITNPFSNRFAYASYFIILSVALIMFPKNGMSMNASFKKVILVNSFFILIILYQMVTLEDFSAIYWMIMVPFLLGIELFVLFSAKETSYNVYLIERVMKYVLVCFYIQLILSVYESLSGSFLIHAYDEYLQVRSQDSFESRFILSNLPGPINPFTYLKLGLSGLHGQHNGWAFQLPFYNLLTAFAYIRTNKRFFLYTMILVLMAQMLNTTRTGILAIFVTDVLVYMKFFYRKKAVVRTITVVAVVAIPVFLGLSATIYNYFADYFMKGGSDTLSIRIDMWRSAIYHLTSGGFFLLTGLGYAEAGRLALSFVLLGGYESQLSSLENVFLDVLFLYGVIGLALFVYFVRVLIWKRADKTYRYFNLLLVVNMMIIGMTLGQVFVLRCYPLLLFCFIAFYLLPLQEVSGSNGDYG